MATNIITINRGDTFKAPVILEDETSETGLYKLKGNDAVYFGLMDPNQRFEDALVKKKLTVDSDYLACSENLYASEETILDESNDLFITLDPEDTIDLLPGRYFYMLKLKMDHEDEDGSPVHTVKTLINKTKFVIYD